MPSSSDNKNLFVVCFVADQTFVYLKGENDYTEWACLATVFSSKEAADEAAKKHSWYDAKSDNYWAEEIENYSEWILQGPTWDGSDDPELMDAFNNWQELAWKKAGIFTP